MLSQHPGLFQRRVRLNVAHGGDTAGKDSACQTCLFKADHPALEAGDRAIYRVRVLLCRSRQQIDIPEAVIGGIEGVGAIQQRLHLSAQPVIVDGRGKHQHIRFFHFLNKTGNM